MFSSSIYHVKAITRSPKFRFYKLNIRQYHEDPFYILGVRRGVSNDDLRKAYVKKVKENHPDLNKNNPKAHENFIRIKKAYEQIKSGKAPPDPKQYRRGPYEYKSSRQSSHSYYSHRHQEYSHRTRSRSHNMYHDAWDDIKTEKAVHDNILRMFKPYFEYILMGSFIVIAVVSVMDKARTRQQVPFMTEPNPRVIAYYKPEFIKPSTMDEMKLRRERFYQEALRGRPPTGDAF